MKKSTVVLIILILLVPLLFFGVKKLTDSKKPEATEVPQATEVVEVTEAPQATEEVQVTEAPKAEVINLFTWEGYIDDDTVRKFTEETGIRINFSTFSTNEEMLLKVQGGDNQYDVILASDYAINILRKGDLLQKLNKELLPNYENLSPAYLSKYYDENNEYTVPYTAGTPVILYDPAAVDFEITSYEDLWDERLVDSLVIIDDARNIVGLTLKTLGQSFNTTDEEVLKQAAEKLAPLRKNIRSFNYDSAYQDLISGECTVGYMFTSYAMIALDARPDLKVVYPKEGLGFGIDSLVIPANAPNAENAHKLLDFLLRGDVAANTAQVQYYMSPNAKAVEFMPESFKQNPVIAIPDELLVDAEFIQDVGEHESDFQAIWQEFKLQ